MRDQLTVHRPGSGRATRRPGGTHARRAQGFDVTGAFGLPSVVVQNNYAAYPVITMYTVPKAITEARVKTIAIQGNPLGLFLARCWWALLIDGGPVTEFKAETTVDDPTAATPSLFGGVRNSDYGSLQIPFDLGISLASGQQLQLQVYQSIVVPLGLTVYTRIRGDLYSRGVS